MIPGDKNEEGQGQGSFGKNSQIRAGGRAQDKDQVRGFSDSFEKKVKLVGDEDAGGGGRRVSPRTQGRRAAMAEACTHPHRERDRGEPSQQHSREPKNMPMEFKSLLAARTDLEDLDVENGYPPLSEQVTLQPTPYTLNPNPNPDPCPRTPNPTPLQLTPNPVLTPNP
jgi:hypothetical protein